MAELNMGSIQKMVGANEADHRSPVLRLLDVAARG